ncbi:LysR family transcriptional regulator [Brevibacterium jeotgali]|uniref:DNA-binding transcriptional regulator, LysR family n=1 Tax=Brevibacterium jeotgali TaxID=1262550 RepID=A0A2H1L683_9MICO|nr:LysR family transcriptional regulator [Brevibacterium jeotgali]TWB98903.1 LysR family transcriptional regulator [Brevibacterium jeotgali]SMY12265.1 DNA-binding transcriptional regulator, LysR family [Brevibacterium jeotgali]
MSTTLLPVELQYFRVTAAAGSVNEAARRLRVASSAVSRQIVKLERSLGVPLFIRHGRGVELTTQGFRLLASVRRSEVEGKRLLADLAQEENDVRRIRVACSDGFAGPLIAQVIVAFARVHPEARVEVVSCSSEQAVRLVRDAHVDIGACFVTGLPDGVRVEYTEQLPMVAVMAHDHVLADRRDLSLAEALEHPYGLLSGQSSQRDLLSDAAAKRGLRLDPVVEADRSSILLDFVRAGGGLIFRSMLGGGVVDDPSLTAVPFAEPELLQRSAQIHSPLPGDLDAAQSEFLDLLISGMRW